MSLHKHSVIRWFTTPGELRRLANEMEAKFPKLRSGDDVTIKTIYSNNDIELRILVDQGWIKEE